MDEESKQRNVIDVFEEIVLKDRRLIYVAGYPRSGTTWLTRLLAQCLNSPSLSWSVNNDVRLPKYRDPAVEGLHRRGRFAVRHGHWKARERNLRREKVVVLHRDPRDVAVSCFHYFPFRRDGSSGMEKCIAEMCGAKGKILGFVNVNRRGWAGYVQEWLKADAVWVRYEDLLADAEATVKTILSRLGVPPQPDKRVRKAVREHTFANRRKDKTMRRGVAGAWEKVLPDALAAELTKRCKAEMVTLGYSVEIAEYVAPVKEEIAPAMAPAPPVKEETAPAPAPALPIVIHSVKKQHSILGRRGKRA